MFVQSLGVDHRAVGSALAAELVSRVDSTTVPRIGSDLVSVADVEGSISAFGDQYLDRVFTALELVQSERTPERLAARFAGKEAVVKILRTSRSTAIPYRDIEIALGPSGAPHVRLHGHAASHARTQGIGHIAVSLSHDHGLAFATAITLLPRKEASSMKDTIRSVLDLHGHLTTPATEIGDADDLYKRGLTSHATVNVMLALEEELDLEFPDELLTRDTFASIDALDAAARSLENA
ncbi:acyl carrier protein [Frondihabitans cladoniiphilus]|uniref:Holo-[acyl-carrier-protein] synthase n=1 Tax=Frondihabitans cladoniiphilus TaxID=715785 RepID=A0ABP8W3L5_9MICO